MDFALYLIDFILHIDVHLSELIRDYGAQTYAILFAIVFIETGLVVMPFLPGDSLLFAAGAFAAKGDFNVVWLGVGLTVAQAAERLARGEDVVLTDVQRRIVEEHALKL